MEIDGEDAFFAGSTLTRFSVFSLYAISITLLTD